MPADLDWRSKEWVPWSPSGCTHSPTGSMTPSRVACVVAISFPISVSLVNVGGDGPDGLYPDDDDESDGTMTESPSQLIDAKIEELDDWRGETLARVRSLVKEADPEVV